MRNKKSLPPKMHLSNGRYYFVHRGKWHPLERDLSTSLEMHAKKLKVIENGGPSQISKHVEVFLAGCKNRLSASTVKNYSHCSRNFEKAFAEFSNLREIKPKHINTWKKAFEDSGKLASWNLHHAFLSGFFTEAVELGTDDVEMTPMAKIRKFPAKKRNRLINDDEMVKIYQNANEIMRAAMMIADQIGQRVSDIRLLRKQDISDKGVFIAQRKSGGRVRILLTMTPELLEAIDTAKALCPIESSPYLFHHTNTLRKDEEKWGPGRPYGASTWCGYWIDACKKAGVDDAHFHDIRARAATTRDEEGGSAMELLGHANQQTTDIYLRKFKVIEVEPVRRKKPKLSDENVPNDN